jgi:hypothetical protein
MKGFSSLCTGQKGKTDFGRAARNDGGKRGWTLAEGSDTDGETQLPE